MTIQGLGVAPKVPRYCKEHILRLQASPKTTVQRKRAWHKIDKTTVKEEQHVSDWMV